MALPIGAVIEATLEGEMILQKIMSVFHYQVSVPSTTPTVSDEVAQFLATWSQGGAGSFFTDYLACLPANYNAQFASAQAIAPTRFVRTRIGKVGEGLRAAANSANLQASITTQTVLAGRSQTGGKRLPISQEEVSEGLVAPAIKAVLDTFTVDILAAVTVPDGGGVYTPCIWHRDPTLGAPNNITRAFTQNTVRVMRRRTVGLGI